MGDVMLRGRHLLDVVHLALEISLAPRPLELILPLLAEKLGDNFHMLFALIMVTDTLRRGRDKRETKQTPGWHMSPTLEPELQNRRVGCERGTIVVTCAAFVTLLPQDAGDKPRCCPSWCIRQGFSTSSCMCTLGDLAVQV